MDKVEIDGEYFKGYTIATTNASMLMINAKGGMLACGYVKVETADKLGDALAIVTGVNNYAQMLDKPVVSVSAAAARLGVSIGKSGREALLLMNSRK